MLIQPDTLYKRLPRGIAKYTHGQPRRSCLSTGMRAEGLEHGHQMSSEKPAQTSEACAHSASTDQANGISLHNSQHSSNDTTLREPHEEAPACTEHVTEGVNTAWLSIMWMLCAVQSFQFGTIFLQSVLTFDDVAFDSIEGELERWSNVYMYFAYLFKTMLLAFKSLHVIKSLHSFRYNSLASYNSAGLQAVTHFSYFVQLVLVTLALPVLCGKNRAKRGKRAAVTVAIALVPAVYSFILLCLVAHTDEALGKKICACALNLVCVVTYACCAAGLFVNGRPAAAYLLPYYHVRVSNPRASAM